MITWIFGNTGAGKTTYAKKIIEEDKEVGIHMVHLDGDDMRATICSDLSLSYADRIINNHRIAALAGLLDRQGFDVVVSVITPYKETRKYIKNLYEPTFVYIEGGAPDSEVTPFEYPDEDEYDTKIEGNVC
jgi:adenylylsulfate kinase-like enzyme